MTSLFRKVKKKVKKKGDGTEKGGTKPSDTNDATDDELEQIEFKQDTKQDTKAHSSGDDDTPETRKKLTQTTVIKTGDYSIQVHVIEARDLKGEDLNGRSDPMVTVEIMGKKKSTNIKSSTSNVKWDEVLYFEFKNVDAAQLQDAKCSLLVYDADLLTRNDLIGSFEIDLAWIYFKKYHECFKQWVALSNNEDDDEEQKEDEVKVSGYLKVSIVVLGPNDEQKIHTEEEMEDEDEGLILIAPEIEQFPHMMKVKIYEARDLPKTDDDLFSNIECNPFVWVEFAGQRLRSEVYEGLNPVFQSEFCIPIMEPVFTKLITITVMDYDKLSRNDRIGVLKFDYQELKEKYNWHIQPQWYSIYGGPLSSNRGVSRLMNRGVIEGVLYRGQILLEITLEKLEKRGKLELNLIDNLPKSLHPKFEDYEFKFHLYEGSEISQVGSDLLGSKIFVEFSVGLLSGKSSEKDLQDGEEGQVIFYEKICNDSGLRTTTFGPVKICLHQTEDICPDIFVYLCMPAIMSKKVNHIAYIRIPVRKIVSDEWGNEPQWYDLKENKALDKYSDQMFPGSLLISINAGLSSELDAPANKSKVPKPFTFEGLSYSIKPPPPKNYKSGSDASEPALSSDSYYDDEDEDDVKYTSDDNTNNAKPVVEQITDDGIVEEEAWSSWL